MFADNQRISHRQLGRQMILTFGGILILLLSGEIAAGGRDALLGLFLGYGVLLLYFFFLVRHASALLHLEMIFGGFVTKLIQLIYSSFLVLTGGVLLERIGKISSLYLVTDTNQEILKVLILMVAVLGMGGDIQKRGRMGEVSFSWIFWGFVLLLGLAAFHMRVPDGSQLPKLETKNILLWGYEFFAIGCTVSIFPFACGKTEGKGSQMGLLGRAWLILTLLVVATAVILLGTYGYPGVATMEFPVLSLMSGTAFPGGFLNRFDIIWMAILLYTLIFSLGSLLFYSVRLWMPVGTTSRVEKSIQANDDESKPTRGKGKKSESSRMKLIASIILWTVAILMWAVSAIRLDVNLSALYLRILGCIYAPLFVIITLLAAWGHRRRYHENQGKHREEE